MEASLDPKATTHEAEVTLASRAAVRASQGSLTDSDGDSLLRELAGAPARVPAMVHLLAPGAIIAGKYRIEEKIGSGGMGAVFRATDLRLERAVAIKVHHGRATSLERLRREARLLARLSHPNVVTVMEVGSHEGAPFVAMEYVAGGSARSWARRPGRTWREIVAVYVQAARGLAAAHAIGIVHRDFKPDNLLVGEDGRARVADFGLADEDLATAEDVPLALALERVGMSTGSHSIDATAAGALVGTPAYVAPEQIRSSRVDARADQFSFCAGLFEALYGALPFPGSTAAEVLGRILEGELAEPPSGRRRDVPRWLHAVVCRGLARAPQQRFADMDTLREALAGPRSRRALGIVGGAAVLAGAALLAVREPETDPRCATDAAIAWNALRAAVSAAFAESADRDAWQRLDRRLAERAQGWSAAWATTCAAERHGTATPLALATMARRLDCLDDSRRLTDELLVAVGEADPAVVAHLLASASSWDDPLACLADASAQAPTSAAPTDPDGSRALLQRVHAWTAAGHTIAASTLAEVALNHAQGLGDDATIARALLARAVTRLAIGRMHAGVDDANAAYTLAERAGDQDVMRDAAVRLAVASRFSEGPATLDWISVARSHLHRWPDDADDQVRLLVLEAEVRADRGELDPALALLDEAEGVASQAAVPGDASSGIWFARAMLAADRGDFGNALTHAERGRVLLEEQLGATHYRVGHAWSVLGFIYDAAGNAAEARDRYRQALALYEGPGGGLDHRQVQTLLQLATLETVLGNSAQALADLDRADLLVAAMGIDDPELVVTATEARGLALLDLGRSEEAYAAFIRVTEMREQLWGTAHPELRAGLLNLALAARSTDRPAEADEALERAVRIQDDLASEDLLASGVYHGFGFALLDQGRPDDAARQFQRADEVLRRGFGDDHPEHGWPALGLGRVALVRGEPAKALTWFRRAGTAWAGDDADAFGKAELATSTAEALRRLGRGDEGIAIARAALSARPGHVGLRGWLDAHAPGAAPPMGAR